MEADGGREGDWDCGGCLNRNYAFRSFCNRCKQPRLLVDTKTPADSKWLPRIGDWICTGCSNNNYASREKCKKCGQPKEIAALPAIAMLGASFPTYAHSFARAHLTPGYKVMAGNSALASNQSCPVVGGGAKYGHHSAIGWPFHGSNAGTSQNLNQFSMVPNGWRSGDWLCNCGFHNYSSRMQCKKCNAPMPTGDPPLTMPSAPELVPTLGTKRLASNEFANDWDNKRQNAGDINDDLLINGSCQALQGFDQLNGSSSRLTNGIHSSNLNETSQLPVMPILVGKRVKHWREGDWMCTNCNNHNFASRSQCNRCKSEKDATS